MAKEIPEASTIPAKYIFLDVVGFTHGRSVEAQSDIVHVLNEIVQASIVGGEVTKDKLILLPTGDGMCIALLNIEFPYDIHLLIALDIVRRVHEHNESIENGMRKFQVRIGLNANTDNLVTDINGNRNIAGAGISMASRVMSMADGNQVLLGAQVFDTLRYREKYMNSFKSYQATVKHGLTLAVYQFVEEGHAGLNVSIPKAFQTPEKVEPKLSALVAYYFAHAIKNREFFLKHKDDYQTCTVLLYFLAKDSKEKSEATEIDTPYYDTYKAESGATLEDQFKYYDSIHYPVTSKLAESIASEHLYKYGEYFEGVFRYQFVNAKGLEKLKREWPAVCAEFGL